MQSYRIQRPRPDRRSSGGLIEPFEQRLLLSAGVTAELPTQYAAPALASVSAIPTGGGGGDATAPFTPAEVRHFYGIDNVTLNGITGDGAGETIGIVDAYEQPNMLDSTDPDFDNSDLHIFDQTFGLPDPPSFKIVGEDGGTDLPTDYNSGWAIEISLDVEWAHAMAPAANIVLVECNSASYDDLLSEGAATASRLADVVSMSFVGGEFDGDSYYDSVFTQPGVTYLASAGDQGSASSGYPAFSPNVVAVGGTEIYTSDSNGSYGSESVWNDLYGATGGGVSDVTPQPSYQANITLGDGFRVIPDVAFNAAPSTGVYVYDSSVNPSGGHFYQVGGTSLSCPCWAGIIAVTDQARSLLGLGALSGSTQTLPRLYQLPATDFNDITVGNNDGYSAGPGYDAATGLGTPIAPTLIPDLAGGDTITGRVFQDNNGNGIFDGTDFPIAGQTVYLDLDNTGVQNANDPTAVSDSQGYYTFTDQVGGETGTVRLVSNPNGYVVQQAGSPLLTTYGGSQTLSTALFPTIFTDTAGSAAYTVQLDSTASTLQILIDGTLEYSAPVSLASSLTFNLTGTGDSLTVNGVNGNPVPSGGISLTGAAGGDPLTVIGTATGNDAFAVSNCSIAFGANPINFTNVSNLLLNPGAGTDSLLVNSGSVTVVPQPPGDGILTRHFSAITLAADTHAIFASAASQADRTLVVTAAISVAAGATLDLGGNDMVVQNGDLAALSSLLASGYNNGNWTGTGIASAKAASDPTYLTALGIIDNTQSVFGPGNLFDGYAPAVTDILIKYTYYGDANLDGIVDGSDYSKIDNGYNNQLTGWENGDFNYDGAINASDYTLIDNAFNQS